MLVVRKTNQFKKDLKLAYKQGRDLKALAYTMELIAEERPLPHYYRDHNLSGNWIGRRECHINGAADWLLIYKLVDDEVIFERLGTHSALFK